MIEHLDKAEELWDKSIAFIKSNPIKGILLLFLLALLIIVGSFLANIGNNLTSFFKSEIPSDEYKHPPLEMYYVKQNEVKEEGTSIFNTTFRLFVHIPPFYIPKNPKGGFNFYWHGDPQIECQDQKWVSTGTESTGSYSSTTKEYEITCKTYKSIIDNGKLFSIKEL